MRLILKQLVTACVLAGVAFVAYVDILLSQEAGAEKKGSVSRLVATEKFRFKLSSLSYSVAFSPDGRQVAAADTKGMVVVCDVLTGKESHRYVYEKFEVNNIAFDSTGQCLLARIHQFRGNSYIKVRDLRSARDVFSYETSGNFLFLPGGKEFVTRTGTTIEVNSLKDGSVIRKFNYQPGMMIGTRNTTFSPDGKLVAFFSNSEKSIHIWGVAAEGKLVSMKGLERPINRICFSPSGRWLVTTSYDEKVRVWNLGNGALIETLSFTSMPVTTAFSPDEKWMAVAFAANSKKISIRDTKTWQEEISIERAVGATFALAFSPKGNLLATATNQVVQVWKLSSLKADPGEKGDPAPREKEVPKKEPAPRERATKETPGSTSKLRSREN